ncbi:MAG TPA: pilus assembly protein PilM, partial [Polyangiaceae bacterium]|nr:pilus assembly protein PilM [Polyangiaceae bacterium]
MANLLGIDIAEDSVRVAWLRTGYRSISVVALEQQPIASYASVADAVRAVVGPMLSRGDSIATVLLGDKLFIRKVELPPTAMRQVAEVLPFELEALLPFDLEDAIFDSRVLPRQGPKAPIPILACAARLEQVKERIELVQQALSAEPERVDASSIALANLAALIPELAVPGPVMLVHLDGWTSDIAVLNAGKVEYVRTVSSGTEGLPASAKELARELRQSLFAWRSQGGAQPQVVYLTGPGSTLPGAEAYLSSELGVQMMALPAPRMEGMTPELQQKLPSMMRAVALAMGLTRTQASVNLRQGPLSYERGFSYLQEKIPLLVGIFFLIFVSFLFSTWMEWRSLSKQTDVLEEALAMVTKQVVGEAIRDPEMAEDAVSVTTSKADDPMPTVDGFDVMIEISKAVPEDMKHDIEELDYQKGKVTIHGIVSTIPEAQQI